jgi:hypothetical protein
VPTDADRPVGTSTARPADGGIFSFDAEWLARGATMGGGLEFALGVLVVVVTGYDLFQAIVLPRPAVARLLFTPGLVRIAWHGWRRLARLLHRPRRAEAMRGAFGPLMVLCLLAVWALFMLLGFGLELNALRDQIRTPPRGLGDSLYLSALSMFTLGYSTSVPVGGAARLVTGFEAAVGLGMVALVISLLFSLFNAFQRREALVLTLDAAAGAPPSGVQLLENMAQFSLVGDLDGLFVDWTNWAAEVLESHLAFPLLLYFRSSHDNEAWLNSFGAVMDAAALVMTTLEDLPQGRALVFLRVGKHLVDDLALYLGVPRDGAPGLEADEHAQACDRLAASGYRLRPRDAAWHQFARLRRQYGPVLARLASEFEVVPAQWIGDRSYLPHRSA